MAKVWQQPSDYQISTMTIVSSIKGEPNLNYNLNEIYTNLKLEPQGIQTITFMGNVRTLIQSSKKKKAAKKIFPNQASFVILVKNGKTVNLKLFSNGKVQITGCQNIIDADYAVKYLLDSMRKSDLKNQGNGLSDKIGFPKTTNDNVVLINSNYTIHSRLNLYKLSSLLDNEWKVKKNPIIIKNSFDPCNYPGIILKYLHNNTHTVSIFIFSTGNINITGAKTTDQLDGAYTYVNKFIKDNFDSVGF
jgi:TATA-box binding protein (TBP) (component of TFIID and TFIIIB)